MTSSPGTIGRTADGRSVLRFERRFAHPPEKVWRAITDPGDLQAWGFPAVVELDLAPGAVVLFHPTSEQRRRFGVDPAPVPGRVVAVEPPHLLEYTWGEEILRWELSADGAGGCRMIFINTIDERDIGTAAAAGWHAGLEVLAAFLDGHTVDWDVWQRAADLEPDYQEYR